MIGMHESIVTAIALRVQAEAHERELAAARRGYRRPIRIYCEHGKWYLRVHTRLDMEQPFREYRCANFDQAVRWLNVLLDNCKRIVERTF